MSIQIPPSITESQAIKTWLFSQNTDGSLSPAVLGGGTSGNVNITEILSAPPSFTNALPVELSDGSNPFGTPSNPLSVNVITGGGSNASVGATGSAAPSSATEIGGIAADGKLRAPATNLLSVQPADTDYGLTTCSVIHGHTTAGGGSYVDVKVSPSGALQVGGTIDAVTAITNQVDTNLKQVGGANVATAAAGVQKVGIVGNAAAIIDAVLGAAKPANVLQVGGNDGTNAFGIPLASGGGSVVVGGSKTSNNAVPGATNVGVLPGVVSAAPPVLTETFQAAASQDLSGNTRVVPSAGLPGIIQKAGGASTGSVASLAQAFSVNVSLGTTIIVVCGVGNTSAPTVSDNASGGSNTYTQDVFKAGAAFGIGIFRTISKAAGALTITVANGGANASLAVEIYEVAGILNLTSYALDQVASASGTSVTPTTVGIVPGFTNQYAFAGFAIGTAAQTVAVTAGTQQWTNDSGQLNPTTPAGLFSFVSASALCLSQASLVASGTITSEPWAVALAAYRPYVQAPADSIVRIGVRNASASTGNLGVFDWPVLQGGASQSPVVTIGGEAYTEGVGAARSQAIGSGASGVPVFLQAVTTGSAASSNSVPIAVSRTPATWRGSQFSGAGVNVLWTPPSAKKARLMRYMIEVGEDATLSGGPLPINLAFSEILGTASGAALVYPGWGFTHRLVVPAAVLATSFNGYQSGWIDLGNGQLTSTAALASASAPVAALGMGIMIPQGTGAINPTWTTSSVTWEAATVGFKTTGGLGNFKLVQQTNAVASTTLVALPSLQNVTGNAMFVFWRATVAGGAPTVTVTDTAGNTYTNLAQVTTGNDYVGLAYVVNMKGNAANVITVTTTTHTSTQIEAIGIEYAGLGSGGVDAAQVGTTGTSTAPASGNYTPATAGDLLFSFFASSGSIASQPTIGSNFRLVGTLFNATQGALCIADNFGNGALTAGIVNVTVVGTEE